MNTINSQEIVGKYLNRYGWSDVNPIGKVIGFRGKTIAIVQRVQAEKQKTKLVWHVGGFAGHCANQHAQEWEYVLTDEVFEVRLSKGFFKSVQVADKPYKFYDFNF